jgi:hypothetical protein
VPTLLGELDANRGSADPHSLNYNDEGSPLVHHVTGLDPLMHMLAHAFLAVAAERRDHPAPDDLAPLTSNEIKHLFTALIARPAHDALHRLRWSQWRRRHQARARNCHYRRQAAAQL